MRCLVTGASGFLGQYIVEKLVAAHKSVKALCRRNLPELSIPGVEVIQGDIRDPEVCRRATSGVDAVLHTAALTGISVQRRPYYEINVLGTENLLRAAIENNVQRFVYTGSPSATDPGTAQEGVNETTPYPKTFLAWYPETKAIAEKKVLSANGTPLPNGGLFLSCSLRPRLIWGPRDRNLIPRLIERARGGHLRRVGDGTNRLDMIYVENAADGHIQALEALAPHSPVAGSAYFLSQGEPVNCWDFINRVLALADIPPVKKSISFRSAWYLGSCFETLYRLLHLRKEPPMTRFLATQLAFSYWFDTSKAKRDFGFEPKISIEEGLRRLAEEMRQNGTIPQR